MNRFNVALLNNIPRTFEYEAKFPVLPGSRVKVPFGKNNNTTRMAVVIDSNNTNSGRKPKTISELCDSIPTLPDIKLINFAASYYAVSLGCVLNTALPKLLRNGDALCKPLSQDLYKLTPLGQSSVVKGKKRQAIKRALVEPAALKTIKETVPTVQKGDLVKLMKEGLITCSQEYSADHSVQWGISELIFSLIPMNELQQSVYDSVFSSLARNDRRPFLLYGITGSGKTNVYFHLIADVLREGKQVQIILPEIGLTPQLIERFEKAFNVPICVMHSGLNDTQRLHSYNMARFGQAAIIIGTRSSVFVPLANPGLIIIDEEHDSSLKQTQNSFSYHARDLAIVKASQCKIPVLLATATPSFESLYNVTAKKYQLLTLNKRATGTLPEITIQDVRGKATQATLTTETISEIGRHIARGGQVIVYIGRRGYAPVLGCPSCGWVKICSGCDKPMVYHLQSARLQCHNCSKSAKMPTSCPACNNNDFEFTGVGTERIQKELTLQFESASVTRVDSDAMRKKGVLANTLKACSEGLHQIIVGTQILTKGHDFPNVTLVVICGVDDVLNSGDIRAKESLSQLIYQVSGRAGRRDERPGKVIIQTVEPDNSLLVSIKENDYITTAHGLLSERSEFVIPPIYSMGMLQLHEFSLDVGMWQLSKVRDYILQHVSNIICGDVTPGPIPKRKGRYTVQLPVYSKTKGTISTFVKLHKNKIENIAGKYQVTFDIDPIY